MKERRITVKAIALLPLKHSVLKVLGCPVSTIQWAWRRFEFACDNAGLC